MPDEAMTSPVRYLCNMVQNTACSKRNCFYHCLDDESCVCTLDERFAIRRTDGAPAECDEALEKYIKAKFVESAKTLFEAPLFEALYGNR